jgi:hypothetical protein
MFRPPRIAAGPPFLDGLEEWFLVDLAFDEVGAEFSIVL